MAGADQAKGRRPKTSERDPEARSTEVPASTRHALLEIVKRSGESDVSGLAEQLGISGVAVRQHLGAMEREGQVAHRLERRPVGRPVRLYRLTAAAERHFPQNSDRVALDLLARMENLMGRAAVEKLFDTRLEDLDKQYRAQLGGARSWSQKLGVLARIRDEEGYLCNVESAEPGEVRGNIRLVEHHCPVASIAKQHPQLCSYELELFKRVLGEPGIRRTEHIQSGGHACAYEVPKSARQRRGK